MKLPLITKLRVYDNDKLEMTEAIFHVLQIDWPEAIGVSELDRKLLRVHVKNLTVLTEQEYKDLKSENESVFDNILDELAEINHRVSIIESRGRQY